MCEQYSFSQLQLIMTLKVFSPGPSWYYRRVPTTGTCMCQKDIVLICVYFNMRDQAAEVPILLPRKSSPLKMYKYQEAQKR